MENDMTEHKHTPGPWVCEEYNEFSDEVVITAADGEYICGIDCDGVYDELTGPKIDADARLIAAAPDMLEALEGVVSEYDELDNGRSLRWAVDHARAVIAKAKGETA